MKCVNISFVEKRKRETSGTKLLSLNRTGHSTWKSEELSTQDTGKRDAKLLYMHFRTCKPLDKSSLGEY